MPVENISGFIQNISDQSFGQTQNSNVQKSLLGIASPVTPAVAEDTFTSSAQSSSTLTTAQDAGLFQFAPGTLTANQSGSGAAPAHGAIPLLGPPQSSTATKPGANGPVTQSQPNNDSNQATNGAASAANVQLQIQSLNASLPALGLTTTEINQIDRIASLVQNFNPAAYANLVSQFEALAQNSPLPTTANSSPATSASSAANAGTNSNNSGYQVQGISLQFTGSTQAGSSSFAG
jgi:hypothetical protein